MGGSGIEGSDGLFYELFTASTKLNCYGLMCWNFVSLWEQYCFQYIGGYGL